MYGLKDKLNTNVFKGAVLEQVSVSANTVSLVFSRQILITMQGRYKCHLFGAAKPLVYSVPSVARRLLGAIESTVVEARTEKDRNLELKLSNGTIISVLDDSDQYESFSIRIAGTEIIV